MLLDQIREIPSIDTHEHIGSLPSCGIEPLPGGGFEIDHHPGYELAATSLLDLFFAPYFSGLLASSGFKFPLLQSLLQTEAKAQEDSCEDYFWRRFAGYGSLDEQTQDRVWAMVMPFIRACTSSGQYSALKKAFQALYQADLDEAVWGLQDHRPLSERVIAHYGKGVHRWCAAMFEQQKILRAVKPVHLSYVDELAHTEQTSWQDEKSIILPILRVDELMGHTVQEETGSGEKSRRHSWHLAERTLGVKIRGIDDIDEMVDRTFALMHKHSIRSIKQLQAYSRTLRFTVPDRAVAKDALAGLDRAYDRDRVLLVQDYVMSQILARADALEMTFQIHTGMANLPQSNPILLEQVIKTYRNVRFVLLHCYPYLADAAYMARSFCNVYLDSAWLSILSPALLHQALDEWIGFVPHNKICLSADATSVEESCGGMIVIRERLSAVLEQRLARAEMSPRTVLETAEALLFRNAVILYPM